MFVTQHSYLCLARDECICMTERIGKF